MCSDEGAVAGVIKCVVRSMGRCKALLTDNPIGICVGVIGSGIVACDQFMFPVCLFAQIGSG